MAWICNRTTPRKVDKLFRRLQLVSAALYSLGHGGNDAQKTIGIIWMLLIAAGISQSNESVPDVGHRFLLCGHGSGHACSAAGASSRPWARRSPSCKPVGGFAAETGGAITLFMATGLGIPVSTTHTITGAIVGVGSTRGTRNVRWGVAGSIVWAWVLTIPATALISAIAWWLGACHPVRRL